MTKNAPEFSLLEDKVCLVTGAGRGIGQRIAEVFVANGAIVYANEVRPGSIEEWASGLEHEASNRVRPVYFDVSDESAVREAFTVIRREEKKLDVLVNNAAIEYNELIGMIDSEHLERMFRVNVFGCVNTIQLASRLMGRKDSGGSIINIASKVGLRGNAGQAVYSATKGAVIALTKSAAKELASKGVRVNAVAPGLVDTEMMRQANQEKLENRIANICMGRLADPLDIANCCLFLGSDLSSYISGQVICVDGCSIM